MSHVACHELHNSVSFKVDFAPGAEFSISVVLKCNNEKCIWKIIRQYTQLC